jgi:hypothetical protein
MAGLGGVGWFGEVVVEGGRGGAGGDGLEIIS